MTGLCDGVSRRLLRRELVVPVLACLLGGCGAVFRPAAAPQAPPVAPAAAARDEAPRGPAAIVARIQELEARLRKDKKADPDGVLTRELALLYAHPENRSPDHGKSLALLRDYRALAPAGEPDLEAERLVALLEAVDRLGRLLRESKTLEKELAGQIQALHQSEREAKQREQDLLSQIKTLQARIEKLQALDLEMEKRRRSVR